MGHAFELVRPFEVRNGKSSSTAGTSGTEVLWPPGATTGHHRIMKRTVVWLTDEQAKALAAMSKKSLAPVSALVRQAVKEFLQDRRKGRAFQSDRL